MMNKEELELIDEFFNKGWCCDLDEVYKAVMKLQQENKQLKEQVQREVQIRDELHNLFHYRWDELKKWLEESLKEKNKIRLEDNNSYEAGVIDTYENIIDKIKELEEGVK